MSRARWGAGLAVLAVGAVLLTMTVASAAETPVFTIIGKGGRLIPAALKIPAGQRVKLIFRNEGPGPEEFEITEMRVEKVLAEGSESFAVLPPRKHGDRLRLFGEFHPNTAECIITVE
jgi:hypothetical protein